LQKHHARLGPPAPHVAPSKREIQRAAAILQLAHLCNALLRTRTGRKPDQAAQGANGFGSHQLPFAACNQFRLILHTAAYWLLHDLRACAPSWNPLQQSEFATIRLRLIKIAGRIAETASRIRVSVASCCPEAALFSLVAFESQKAGP